MLLDYDDYVMEFASTPLLIVSATFKAAVSAWARSLTSHEETVPVNSIVLSISLIVILQ